MRVHQGRPLASQRTSRKAQVATHDVLADDPLAEQAGVVQAVLAAVQ
jgi:hypothetical protein